MTLEERFREAAASLVAVSQDNDLLQREVGELKQQLAFAESSVQGKEVTLIEGMAILAALLDCEGKGMDYWNEQAPRAREWLATAGGGG